MRIGNHTWLYFDDCNPVEGLFKVTGSH